jgi:hypothetical protein
VPKRDAGDPRKGWGLDASLKGVGGHATLGELHV